MNELAQLESDEGVRVVVQEEEYTLRAQLVSFTGDSKSAHHILGFLDCSARHFCRLCMISRNEHLNGVEFGEACTRALHANHLQQVAGGNERARTDTGVKGPSCLNNARFFHCVENYVFDCDHDLAEGIIAIEIRLVLRHFVCVEEYFTVQELNRRIRAFNYGTEDAKNNPSANFTLEYLRNALTAHSLKQTMGQT